MFFVLEGTGPVLMRFVSDCDLLPRDFSTRREQAGQPAQPAAAAAAA